MSGIRALTVEEATIQQMAALYPRTHGRAGPDRYRAIAEWWRLHATTSANPEESIRYAENQDRLAAELEGSEAIPPTLPPATLSNASIPAAIGISDNDKSSSIDASGKTA